MLRKHLRHAVLLGLVLAILVAPMPAAAASPPSPRGPATGDAADGVGLTAERARLRRASQPATTTQLRPSQPLTGCGAYWRTVESPNGSWNNLINGMAALSPTDMWA